MKTNPHERLFSHYPLFQLAPAFAGGVYLSTYLITTSTLVLTACAVCTVVTLLMVVTKHPRPAGLALLSAMFFAGASLAVLEKSSSNSDDLKRLLDSAGEKQAYVLTGVLTGPPEFARDRLYLLLRVESVSTEIGELKTTGLVSLLAIFKTTTSDQEYRQLNLQYGARLRVKTTLHRNDQYRNPGVSTLTEYLDRKGHDATGVIKSPASIVRLGDAPVFKLLAWLYKWREQIQRDIDRHFSPETAGVLDAALLGNRHNLSRTTAERFRDGGTFHVIVISGVHISFIGGVVFLIAKRLTQKRLLQLILSGSVVWSYTLAVGAEASVVRAALMFTFVALAFVVFRPATLLNALGGAALVLLISRPKDLFDPSFQLTFLSVLAIVVIAWPLLQNFKAIGGWRPTRSSPYPPDCLRVLRSMCEVLHWSDLDWKRELDRSSHSYRLFKTPIAAWFERTYLQRVTRYTFNAIVVSTAVQIMLLPLLVIYFHRLSLSSLLLNIVVSLSLAVLALVSFIALLLSHVSLTIAEPLFTLANGINWLMIHSIDPFAKLGLASVRLPEYAGRSSWLYFVYYVPLAVLISALFHWCPLAAPSQITRSKRLVPLFCCFQLTMIAVVLFHPFSTNRSDGKLHVDFLDVGQGDAAFVTMPDGATLLIDGGGRPSFRSPVRENGSESFERESRSIGEMVVSEYLWWRGLDSVDYVLATHADADHLDGLNDVLMNFSVRSALVGRTLVNDNDYSKFVQTLTKTRTPVEVVQAGDVLKFGGVSATVLWPTEMNNRSADSQNNDSVVVLLKFGDRSILFTGDIEKEAERRLVASLQNLRVDVVKVPHHGSRTSSTEAFVDATKPRLAVIPVGRESMFGHPHKEVVERWEKSGAEILTTGRSGTITVTTDGKDLWVKKLIE